MSSKCVLTASIIGSFRKYYETVKDAIRVFETAGIAVLSPKYASVVNPEAEFVILNTDAPELDEIEIQLIALHRIMRSDFVYVCNIAGYVGRTTCYEIGRVLERRIPLFFMEVPKDLPVFLPKGCVCSPQALSKYFSRHKTLPVVGDSEVVTFAQELDSRIFGGRFYE